MFAVGEAAITYGLADKGLTLMEKAIAAGVRRNPEDAQLRYAVALLKAGKRAQAEPLLRAIKGADGAAELARYWLMASR
jgi:hypothetical protein